MPFLDRMLLRIEYDGTPFVGWQSQENGNSIQHELEIAATKLTMRTTPIQGAGRTDAGVHATGQIAHFETNVDRTEEKWLFGLNSLLPNDIKINYIKFMSEEFNARFSALSRSYRYIIYNSRVKPCINRNKVSWYFSNILDEKKMQDAANKLIGVKDFTCFRSAHCQSSSPIRKVNSIVITRENNYIYIDLNANSFLYNMVRNLIGSLVLVGSEQRNIEWIEELLNSKDRKKAGKQFPASGLYLVNVEYDLSLIHI